MKYKNAPDGWHPPSRLVTVKAMCPKYRKWNIVHLFFGGSCYAYEIEHYTVIATYFGVNYYVWQDYKRPQGISEFSRSEKHMLHMNKMQIRETIKRRARLRHNAEKIKDMIIEWYADKG